jgi:hypothetical protein
MHFILIVLVILAIFSLCYQFREIYQFGDAVTPTRAIRFGIALFLFGMSFLFASAQHELIQLGMVFASLVVGGWKFSSTLD